MMLPRGIQPIRVLSLSHSPSVKFYLIDSPQAIKI
jgi:hypothetical protein